MASTTTAPTPSTGDALSADSVDTLAELASILSRLRGSGGALGAAVNTGGTPSLSKQPGVTGTTPLPSSNLAASSTPASGGGGGGGSGGQAQGPLAPKDVPAATDALKHKLQRARARARELPDAGRTTAQQEAEMAELEARIERQREVLGRLREVGIRFASGAAVEDVGMVNGSR